MGGQNRDGKGARQFATFQLHIIPLPHQGWGRQTKDKIRATRTRREEEAKQWEMEGQNREGTRGWSGRGQGVKIKQTKKKEQKKEETKHKTLREERKDKTKQD